MARKKKSVEETTEKTILRNYDIYSLENRVHAMDKKINRSYDIYSLEKRIHDLEKSGTTPTPPTPTNPGDLYIRDDATNKITYVINDEDIAYYFNGFTKDANDANFPSDFNYLIPNGLEKSKAFDSDKTTQIGWIGWYNNKIRTWSLDLSTTISGTFWGVVIVGDGETQNNDYTNPPERG